jgi:hypothetical protein
LEGTYYIRLKLMRDNGYTFDEEGNAKTYKVAGTTYDAASGAAVNPGATVSEIREAERKAKEAADALLAGNGSGSGSGGGGGSGGPDPVKEGEKLAQRLQRDIALLQAKSDLEKQLLQIKYKQADAEANIRATAAAAQQDALIQQNNTKARLESTQAIEKATEAGLASAKQFLEAGKAEADLLLKKQEYLEDGIAPALAQQFASIDQQVEKQLQQIDITTQLLEAELLRADVNEEIKKKIQEQIDLLNGTKKQIENEGNKKKDRAAAEGEGNKIQDYIAQLEADLNDFDGMVVSLAGTIESELGSAMSSAITGIIDGTQTAQEAFSQMFKNIGAAFIDMATQMIAKALVMKALGILTGGGGFNAATTPLGAGGGNVGGIGTFGPNFGIAQSANGGRLGVGMPSFVGERGPEVFIPDSAGTILSNEEIFKATRNAMKRPTGNSNVVQSEGDDAAAFAAAAGAMSTSSTTRETTKMREFAEVERQALANPEAIDVKYESTVINNESFVTESQFQKGIAQSVTQARAQTLKDLRNKPATRKRVGVS